jgi:hypothetical protein
MYFPDLNPVLKGLNTYYIKTDKLIEHFQGEIGTGVIYFKGPVTEGTVFFESDHYIKSFFKKNDKIISGDAAFSLIMENCEKSSYEIYIYYLEPDEVYLWSEILMSVPVNLGIELNSKSIRGMLEDFTENRDTGYFITGNTKNTYGIFFAYGEVSGYLINGDIFLKNSKDYEKFLKDFLKFLDKNETKTDIYKKALKTNKNDQRNQISSPEKSGFDTGFPTEETIGIMAEFIFIFEDFVSKNKKIKSDFLPMLKKKFIEYIDDYDFLDPFAAEFVYSQGKIKFSGVTDERSFVESLFKCILEIASENGQIANMEKLYKNWSDKNHDLIEKYNLKFHLK